MKSISIRDILTLITLLLGIASADAFSLGGARADWHTTQLGYNAPFVPPSTGGPGPVNFHEEYRWNAPIITYGFTPRFMSYFGQKGVEEVEKALKILSDLGELSNVNIDNFPLSASRINYRAQQVGIRDLKSQILGFMLTQYGLGVPTLYVNTARKRWVDGNPQQTNYLIIRRNFDPVTYLPTPYINGQLWTYIGITEDPQGGYVNVLNQAVDPLFYEGTPSTDFSYSPGVYLSGLTRDDIGGLKYIYNRTNINYETLQPGTALGTGTGGVTGGGGGNVWVPITTTNTTTTNVVVVGGNTNLVDQALRPGIGRFQFVKLNYDSTVGAFIPATVNWTDRYVTNGVQRTQQVTRSLTTEPDLLFGSTDNSGGPDDDSTFIWTASTWDNYVNTATLIETNPGNGRIAGPGVINGPRFLILNDSQLTAIQNVTPSTLDEFSGATDSIIWGSFNGTTNEPVVFPHGTKISDIEYLNFADTTSGSVIIIQ